MFQPFDLSAALSLAAVSLSFLRRWLTSGWTATNEAARRGCWCSSTSLFSPADAKVRGQEGGQEVEVGAVGQSSTDYLSNFSTGNDQQSTIDLLVC